MSAEAVFNRFSIMSFFKTKKLSEQCLSASSDDMKEKYENLADKKIKLQRKMKQMESKGKQNTQEYYDTQSELDNIDSQI